MVFGLRLVWLQVLRHLCHDAAICERGDRCLRGTRRLCSSFSHHYGFAGNVVDAAAHRDLVVDERGVVRGILVEMHRTARAGDQGGTTSSTLCAEKTQEGTEPLCGFSSRTQTALSFLALFNKRSWAALTFAARSVQ